MNIEMNKIQKVYWNLTKLKSMLEYRNRVSELEESKYTEKDSY